jgi:hypothetical protein
MPIGRMLAFVIGCGLLLSCRKAPTSGDTAQPDVLKNLEGFVEPVKAGLSEAVNPRFLTFGPVPTEQPWERPVATGALMVMNRTTSLRTGHDGLIHERYEARPCPLKPIFECVELLATGRFGGHGEVMCFGLQLQKQGDQVVRQEIPMRAGSLCPYQAAPGPAEQVIRGVEKAQMEHFKMQDPDRHLDPTAR